MSALKDRLQSDLHTAMKSRDELVTSTLRMALAAVRTAEVEGTRARELDDDAVLGVLTREAKKRREAATAFADAGRGEQADRERAEEVVLSRYLPAQLTDEELAGIIDQALVGLDLSAGRAVLGQAMKAAQAAVAGRAEGGRVAAAVRQRIGA
jgi:uncharacterized protein YqeY